ncbi:MAG: helix-turn-helix domain-containing protein [Ruminococcus sp.]
MNKNAMTPQGQYHGPLPVRDFFPLPNVIFDLGLTAEEIAIYAFLMKCEDRRTYTCYPSYKTIGKAIGKSKNTVIKYVNMLEEKSLLFKRHTFVITKDGKAWNGNLLFTIAPIRSAIDVYYYHQMWDRKNIQYIKSEKRAKRR